MFSPGLVETVISIFNDIISAESSSQKNKGDHFSSALTNARIWNSLQKHAIADSKTFAEYYSNPWLRLVCLSYLGPAYRITAQVNVVRPGGRPQVSHRDYHLGFQPPERVIEYSTTAHAASALLTLQGAVAHGDMPLESGPTRLLPFSQHFPQGYLATSIEEFRTYFEKNYVSLPLSPGDGLFFNPALIHAAGQND
ncbi:hypothetical protein B7463_g12312, partial [Scytalidium lignicola]